uniref:UDP-N-acetylglucosamine--undecaprenyl-phosphate N-acetylglucosaminephosphotransferase n=1 Tax=Ningiella ruwaisensis TaxID=2364274 RepID=UPI00109F9721|nr:UDP-N-acetylglucosamine--undecaprenyl-phosphate N-acetylglucosaminephosphotransferase [Ningiella ruwaisensis]
MFLYLELMPLLTTFALALVMLLFMSPLAHQLGLVDHPSARKHHNGTVPLTGGLAIFSSVLVASLLFDVWYERSGLFFTASFLIVLLGMLDDKFDLSAKGRLICQFLVASIMVWVAQNSIMNLGDIFSIGDIKLDISGYFFTMVCVVGVVNAFNMIDGIDGLAGGISLIVLLAVVFLLVASNNGHLIMTPMMMVAAIVPFLAFNLSMKGFKGNKIFMGDSGSMFVGLTIVWLLVDYTQGSTQAIRPITAVWIIGLPLLDMAAIMYRRARKGQSMLRPDRQHLHNIFMRAGLSSHKALLAILALGLLCAIVGIVGEIYNVAEYIMFSLFIVTLIVYSFVLQNIWTILSFIRKLRAK